MDKDILFNIILITIMVVLLLTYLIYVIYDERKKRKYYKYTILYETDWDMYSSMVQKQRRILLGKKIQLLWLTFLVKIKEIFRWT